MARLLAACLAGVMAAAALAAVAPSAAAASPAGGDVVRVGGDRLLRDERPWIPHGFYQIAFEVPPTATGAKPFWKVAYDNYTPAEYAAMRAFGADSVRIQLAQTGMDRQDPHSTEAFRTRAIGAIRAARAAGLVVIVSVQDEPHTASEAPQAPLPDAATGRVWRLLAPLFGADRGVLFELYNEPHLPPSPANWQAWAAAMNATIRTVRDAGAKNVVVADGLGRGEFLSGAPRLTDPLEQVAYADHPYAFHPGGQQPAAWTAKFGRFSQTAPVIITEWGTGYFCNAQTPGASVAFLNYLQSHGIGLEVGFWDWPSSGFGSAMDNFPDVTVSRYVGPGGQLSCSAPGFGIGRLIASWYRTGIPPDTIE